MKTLLLAFFCIMMHAFVYSQRIPSQENQPILENKASNETAAFGYSNKNLASFGTFQIVLNNSEMQFAVSEETLVWIEESRLLEEDQTVTIDENVSVFIPSKRSISSQEFKPLTNVRYTN
jgi:hypothetical protein